LAKRFTASDPFRQPIWLIVGPARPAIGLLNGGARRIRLTRRVMVVSVLFAQQSAIGRQSPSILGDVREIRFREWKYQDRSFRLHTLGD